MIISLTGHTRGLGKDIFDTLNKSFIVKGFSRREGWDIKEVDKIIPHINDTDVFINNAYYKNYQSELFLKVFDLWKYTNKFIININSSIAIDGNSDSEYYHNKVKLKDTINKSLFETPDKTVKIMNLYPSTLSTNYQYKNLNKIDNSYITSLIEWSLNQPFNVELRDVSIYPTIMENKNKTLL
jgi:hypothetical protein